jgi:hypothetical protein
MRVRIAIPEAFVDPPVIDAALEAVTRLDESMIRQGQCPTSHELIERGAKWRPEDPGDEHFDHGNTIQNRGWGDCDDWAPLHAATLRATDQDPGAVARVIPSGPNLYHAIVQRSDGTIEDPSQMAGMKAQRIGEISDELLRVWACDPHDGRIYQGQLAPTVGPLSIHCGPGLAVRKAHVVGLGPVYEGRCDVPIAGSPLVGVRARMRRRGHPRHRVHGVAVVGALPYAISCTGIGCSALDALNKAVVGAILCGDAMDLNTSLDRYKLLAIQSAMAGHTPGEVREQLRQQITNDLHAHAAATNTDPLQHSTALLNQLASEGTITAGTVVVGDIFSDIGHIASGVVSAVSNVASTVAKAVTSPGVWGTILHDVQAAVSVVPGLGTAVSDVIAAAETAYDAAAAALSGHPILGAIDAAYNFALASVPGASALHPVLDPVKNTIENIAVKGEPPDSSVLNGLLSSVPDAPKFGSISPRSVAGSLAHIVVSHLGMKHSGPVPVKKPPLVAHPNPVHPALSKTPPKPKPLAHVVTLAKAPPGVPHAAVHTDAAVPPPKTPGAQPGGTNWLCTSLGPGQWSCHWG